VHLIQEVNHGDLFVCKNNIPILIDCKTLNNKNGLFPTLRIEENQRLAYEKFKACGNDNYYLAILWQNKVYIIPMNSINFLDKSIDLKKYKEKWSEFYE
jgi:hypothetical protein